MAENPVDAARKLVKSWRGKPVNRVPRDVKLISELLDELDKRQERCDKITGSLVTWTKRARHAERILGCDCDNPVVVLAIRSIEQVARVERLRAAMIAEGCGHSATANAIMELGSADNNPPASPTTP